MKKNKIEIKRVLFVEPKGSYLVKKNGEISRKHMLPPLGPAMLASVVEKADYEVKIIDTALEGFNNESLYIEDPYTGHKTIEYGMKDDDIIAAIRRFDPQVIGVSNAQAIRFAQTIHFCRLAKKANPEIIVIVGGSNASVMYEDYLNEKSVDLIAIGEGEDVIIKILKSLETDFDQLASIDGIVCNDLAGMFFINPKTKWRNTIHDLPNYAWHLLPMHKYGDIADKQVKNLDAKYISNNRFVAYFSSRGCPHNCIYCAISLTWGKKYRTRNAISVVDEMQLLSEKYGIKEIHFLDSNFLANPKRVIEICKELIRRDLDIQWCVPPGFEIARINYELMVLLKKAKCYAIYLPIESGNQGTLNDLADQYQKTKRVNLNSVSEIIQQGKDLGFYLSGYFMLGMPNETKQDFYRTIEYASSLCLDGVHFFIATPLKGTKLYQKCLEEDLLPYGWHPYRMRYSIGNIRTKEFDPEFCEKMRREGWVQVMERSPKTKQSFEDMFVENFNQ